MNTYVRLGQVLLWSSAITWGATAFAGCGDIDTCSAQFYPSAAAAGAACVADSPDSLCDGGAPLNKHPWCGGVGGGFVYDWASNYDYHYYFYCEAEPTKSLGAPGGTDAPSAPKICAEAQSYRGNPVNVSVGNKFESAADYVATAPSRLRFVRYYNSSGPAELTNTLGPKWHHTYEQRIVLIPSGTAMIASVYRPDGKRLYFRQNGSTWVPDADVQSNLEQVTDGSGTTTSWRYSTPSDTVETYDAIGRLQSIKDVRGNIETLYYNSSSQLNKVTDSVGNYLSFLYDAQGRLQSVTDRANRSWSYRYDANGNLEYVDNPDGTYRQYHYNESAYTSGANLPHALTGITDERGVRYATFEYYFDTRTKASYHAGNVGRVDIAYDDVDGTRTVTDSRKNQTTYTTITQLGSVLPSQITGPSCGCGGP